MPRKKRRAVQLKEARAIQERRRGETAEREPSQPQEPAALQPEPLQPQEEQDPQPEIQAQPEPELQLQVPLAEEQPGPSTSRADTGLVIPLHPPRTPSPPEEEAEPTRSEKKLSLFPEPDDNVERLKRTVIDLTQIEELVGELRCHHCLSDNGLAMETPIRFGLAIKLVIVCRDCGETLCSKYTSARNLNSPSTPKPFVINEAATMSSLLAGMGPYSFRNFCEYMELPGIHPKTFNKIANRLYSQNQLLEQEVFTQAASLVRQEHIQHFHLDVDDAVPVDISVSYDGSWLTRGHKSLIGIGCVIDVLTGLIIGGHVLSLYCHICARTGAFIKRETPQRYDRWFQEHLDSGECTVNFAGSSGMMEVKIAEVLWSRSVERFNLRYTTMVSDGDSKAFNKLTELQPYGPDTLVVKEDCINHVGKRLGAALRNLVADCSKRGVTLGGRGHGRLTAETIRKLQIYYTRAIRSNQSAEEMRQAVMAGIHHGYSTDDFPQHQFCPPGPESWCFYKRSIGEHIYPSGHRQRVHTPLNYSLLHQHLEPIYNRLTSLDLLRRCELKTTQNPNESFHHSVWSRCSKKIFHSLKRVQFALVSAAAEHNSGPSAVSVVKKTLGIQEGEHGRRLGDLRAKKRLYLSSQEQQKKAKKRKKIRAAAQEKARQEKEAEEGGPAYQSGMF